MFIASSYQCPVLVFIYFYSGKEQDKGTIRGLSLIATTTYFKGINDMIASSSGGQGKGMLWHRKGETTSEKSDIQTAVQG
jgi:hypothetical protein